MESYQLKNGTKVFQYGLPIETKAVIAPKRKMKLKCDLDVKF